MNHNHMTLTVVKSWYCIIESVCRPHGDVFLEFIGRNSITVKMQSQKGPLSAVYWCMKHSTHRRHFSNQAAFCWSAHWIHIHLEHEQNLRVGLFCPHVKLPSNVKCDCNFTHNKAQATFGITYYHHAILLFALCFSYAWDGINRFTITMDKMGNVEPFNQGTWHYLCTFWYHTQFSFNLNPQKYLLTFKRKKNAV